MGTYVKTVLFKAFYRYCTDAGIDYMVIAARSPLDRQYDQLMFSDIYPERGFIPMRHGGNIPHRALNLEVGMVESNWGGAKHPLFDLFFRTRHPDIDVRAARTLPASRPQQREAFVPMMREAVRMPALQP